MRIKDWGRFQHFKDRRPPWIKLYRDLLDDDEYYALTPQSAKVLILLWLLASEDETKEGCLPPPKKIAFRLRISEKLLESIISDLSHWLIHDDITMISPRYQVGSSETETYKAETETQRSDDFEQFWDSYPRKIGKKAAFKAWQSAKDKPDLARILSALTAAKQSPDWTKEQGKFIPHPATWLNQGRWDDEVQSRTQTTTPSYRPTKVVL